MNRFACGSCSVSYDRKYSPRYVSACETEYPINLGKFCAKCGELNTNMVICLPCALDANQCQECRAEMFGVSEDLLLRVRDLRSRFDLSIGKHRTAFAEATAGYAAEIESYFAQSEQALNRMNAEMVGLDDNSAAERYASYRKEIRNLPFPHRKEYEVAKSALERALSADRKFFAAFVDYAYQTTALRKALVVEITTAINPWFAPMDQKESEPLNTDLSLYARSQLTPLELQELESRSARASEN